MFFRVDLVGWVQGDDSLVPVTVWAETIGDAERVARLVAPAWLEELYARVVWGYKSAEEELYAYGELVAQAERLGVPTSVLTAMPSVQALQDAVVLACRVVRAGWAQVSA